MESLYLLIPLSAGLVLLILGVFGWALHKGQFEELDFEGERILLDEAQSIDGDQAPGASPQEESSDRFNARP